MNSPTLAEKSGSFVRDIEEIRRRAGNILRMAPSPKLIAAIATQSFVC